METKSNSMGLGIFIVVALLILAAGVFLIGDKDFLFNSTYRLKAGFQNVVGLNKGADVRVGGLREGTVSEIDLSRPPDRTVTVVMKMRKATMGVLRKDSIAAIKTEGILGDKYVEITLGSKEAATVEDGDAIHSEPTVDVADVANSVALQVKSTLAAVQVDMEALRQNFLLRGFFNRRGYEDAGDLTKHATARLPAKRALKEFAYEVGDLFDKADGVKLKNQKVLDEAGQFLEKNGFGVAVVVVSAGMVGDSEKERTLTQTQAMGVRDYLVQTFAVDDTRVKTMGLGKTKQAGDSGKVKILVYSGVGAAPTGQTTAPTGHLGQ